MTRIWVLLTGAAGLAIALRAAAYYNGVDSFAFTITLVMAAALCAGVVELLLRARQVSRLSDDLSKVVAKADAAEKAGEAIADLEAATPRLRAVLRSHLERDPMPTRAPLFTPYLVGLLVMLGLLGTFLGLFETLRGAREALSSSADVDALRAGLSTPMAGLMRSFGTSAAGVASSAMLGLGAVFVRRSARAFEQAVHRACAQSLAHLSAARRQLTALVALAEQGESLPAAAKALAEASQELAKLRAGSEAAQLAQREGLDEIGTRLQDALGETASALETRFSALEGSLRDGQQAHLSAASEANRQARADAAAQHTEALDALREGGRALQGGLETVTSALERRFGEATRAMEQGLEGATLALAESSEGSAKTVESRLASATHAMEAGLAASAAANREGFEHWTASFARADEARQAAFSTQMGDMLARLDALEAAWRNGHARAAEQVREVMTLGIAEASKAAGESVEPTVARIVEATERSAAAHLEELRRQLEADAETRRGREEESVRALAAHARSVEAALEAARSERLEKDDTLLARFDAHVSATLERLDASAEARSRSDEARAQAFAATLDSFQGRADARSTAFADSVAQATERWSDELASITVRDGERAASLLQTAERVEAQLGSAAEVVAARLASQAEASERGDARAAELLTRLDEVVANVSAQADAQRSASEALLARQDARGAEFEQAATSRLEALMAAIGEASELQASRIAAFEEALAERQAAGAERLRGQLVDEARQLGEGLDRAADMVREAASLVQAGGAELSAAVELFGGSVQMHGEAAQRWLTGLSVVERSVEEAGEGAAVEVLGEYLTRTHELFDQQLGFQQELLEQLRRGAPPADA